jgi:hypothetical protein
VPQRVQVIFASQEGQAVLVEPRIFVCIVHGHPKARSDLCWEVSTIDYVGTALSEAQTVREHVVAQLDRPACAVALAGVQLRTVLLTLQQGIHDQRR